MIKISVSSSSSGEAEGKKEQLSVLCVKEAAPPDDKRYWLGLEVKFLFKGQAH